MNDSLFFYLDKGTTLDMRETPADIGGAAGSPHPPRILFPFLRICLIFRVPLFFLLFVLLFLCVLQHLKKLVIDEKKLFFEEAIIYLQNIKLFCILYFVSMQFL